MKLADFKTAINRAERVLIDDAYYEGVCIAILDADLGCRVCEAFERLLKPTPNKFGGYWLGPLTQEYLSVRQIALRLFEQHCIEHKLYREF